MHDQTLTDDDMARIDLALHPIQRLLDTHKKKLRI